MKKLYYCEYLVNRNFASRYVIARNQLDAVDLILLHYKTLSPYLNVTDISIRNLEFISSQTINLLHSNLHGNN